MSTPTYSHRGITIKRVAKGWYEFDTVTLTANTDLAQPVLYRVDTVPTFGIEATRQRINEMLDNGGRRSMSGKIIVNQTEWPIERALQLAGPFTTVVAS